MKKLWAMPLIICAACCLLAAGCTEADEKELYYDATVEPNKIAASGYDTIYTMECCVIFKAGFLKRYVGWDIVAVKLFNPVDNQIISYTPVLYEADAGAASPGDQVSLNAGPAEIDGDTWQTITLDTPVTIEASRDYWQATASLPSPA